MIFETLMNILKIFTIYHLTYNGKISRLTNLQILRKFRTERFKMATFFIFVCHIKIGVATNVYVVGYFLGAI